MSIVMILTTSSICIFSLETLCKVTKPRVRKVLNALKAVQNEFLRRKFCLPEWHTSCFTLCRSWRGCKYVWSSVSL